MGRAQGGLRTSPGQNYTLAFLFISKQVAVIFVAKERRTLRANHLSCKFHVTNHDGAAGKLRKNYKANGITQTQTVITTDY